MPELRCSLASEDDAEPIAGTAPTESEWLFVEDAGPWPAKATKHLAEHVARLAPGGRAQLIRRHGGGSGPGVRVFRASLGATPSVSEVVLRDYADLGGVATTDFTPYGGPLWLVCTNGRRDVCCAERGRPVAAALAARWPEGTWETTHLGGHRFAATLLALPHAVALGRLDAFTAVEACTDLEAGRLPLDVTRGRAGWPGAAQWADLSLRDESGWTGLGDVDLLHVEKEPAARAVRLSTPDGPQTVRVVSEPGGERLASCGDALPKTTSTFARAPSESV
ncbi:sucrase ferredoxin [Nocardioides sp.]|uniref:sucrase ferredoxin n=1 Tax=Nocardioides sp. TaxID=35761 RepID=UPI002B27360A|nr:sucrase ferredoxin [Nocardioides sp.]